MEVEKEFDKKLSIKDGIIAGIPIVIGYLPIAMTFGILAKTVGISIVESFLFSAIVFAGASQFIALNLLCSGVGMGGIILTTLLVNFRHFLMSASLATRLTKDMKKWIPFIAFGTTDEMFSVASFKEEKLTKEFILALQFVSYLSWVMGTVFGYLIGEVLPVVIKSSMGIALYAMFAAILIPEVKKSNKILFLALLSGGLNALVSYLNVLPKGWSLILAIVVVSAIGSFIFKEEEECVYE